MRVISGTAKGRPLKAVPGTGTRPTTDKVKEAIFSMIGPYFSGGWALDLFAGTGGLGIEALSRGADRAVFVDLEKKSIEVVEGNLQSTGLRERAEIYRNEAVRAVKALAKRDVRFRLVFLDPPYRMKHVEELLGLLEASALLEPDVTIVVEHEASHRYADRVGALSAARRTEYGDTAVTVYRFEEQASDRETEAAGQA